KIKNINIYNTHNIYLLRKNILHRNPMERKKVAFQRIPCGSKHEPTFKNWIKLEHNHFLQLI
ncbi:hypothetical protein L2190_05670, partial [Lactobacillus gasseri]|nr:hypothetical protein [Lactobacillus gasseri]